VFEPPRCPSSVCVAHLDPTAAGDRFYVRKGSYQPQCRPWPVPRFRCKLCGKGFSRQTFRADYCDNKPYLNAPLCDLLASGMGLRQSARVLGLARRSLELKARKLSRHLGRLQRNFTDQFTADARFSLDEMETFEGERGVLPVSVPILIETRSMYVVATDVATIKPSGRMSKRRKEAIAAAQLRHGKREDRSVSALQRVFRRLRFYCRDVPAPRILTDKKTVYRTLVRRYLGQDARHDRYSSKLRRDQSNPLKDINLTNAMARDLNGRLRRESWLVSKWRRYLRLQLHVFAAYRNFVRWRTNRDPRTPAQVLGFVRRRARFADLLGWRQDWRWRSIHPESITGQSIAEVRRW